MYIQLYTYYLFICLFIYVFLYIYILWPSMAHGKAEKGHTNYVSFLTLKYPVLLANRAFKSVLRAGWQYQLHIESDKFVRACNCKIRVLPVTSEFHMVSESVCSTWCHSLVRLPGSTERKYFAPSKFFACDGPKLLEMFARTPARPHEGWFRAVLPCLSLRFSS